MITTRRMHMCDVCRLLDYDVTEKFCGYCPMCDAWICQADENRWGRRLRAAIKRRLEPGYAGTPDYVETTNKQLEEAQVERT